MDGLISIDKPRGLTSHDVVLRIRRLFSGEKTGHCGTLDPEATGVLLIAVGRATRLFRFLAGRDKAYQATIRLGFSTDTYDSSGRMTSPESHDCPQQAAVLEAMKSLKERTVQFVPPFSAKKLSGKPMYKLARANKYVPQKSQQVLVRHLLLEAYKPPLVQVSVECSAGTYIRSLAHDLGQILGCGSHLTELRRTASGDHRLSDCHLLDSIENWARAGQSDRFFEPLEKLLPELPRILLTAQGEDRTRHGNRVLLEDAQAFLPEPMVRSQGREFTARLFDGAGKLLALARYSPEEKSLRPFIVFAD